MSLRRRSSAAPRQAIQEDDGPAEYAPLRWQRVSSIAPSQLKSPQPSRRPLRWLAAGLIILVSLGTLSYSSRKSRRPAGLPRTAQVPAPYTDLSELYKSVQLGEVESDWTLLKDWKFPRNKQVPRECLTYEERYGPYRSALPANIPVPPVQGTTTAFLSRIMPDRITTEFRDTAVIQDLVVANRALVSELQQIGIDLYFVVDQVKGSTRESWLEDVHPDFRERVFDFSFSDFLARFPDKTFSGRASYDNHVSISAFMDSELGQQYDFVWWMEDDIRATSSWATIMTLLNATVPLEQPPPQPWEVQQHRTAALQHEGRYMPDLFLTADWWPQQKKEPLWDPPGPYCASFAKPAELAKALINLTGYSRAMHQQMMAHYAKGHSCYIEHFVPTVAKRSGLKIHHAQLPSLSNPALYPTAPSSTTWAHWWAEAASIYYDRWKSNSSICRPTALLHKVVPGLSALLEQQVALLSDDEEL